MTRDEILKRIKELEEQEFLIQMADFLSRDDWKCIYECRAKVKELKEMLGEE